MATSYVEKVIDYAPEAFRLLRGLACVYKPPDVRLGRVKHTIAEALCKDLNSMKQRPIMTDVAILGSLKEGNLKVITHPSYSDNPLVTGPRYQTQDIKISSFAPIWPSVSGVTPILFFGKAWEPVFLRSCKFVRTYNIHCKLGLRTDSGMSYGRPVERSAYGHVTPGVLERILGSYMALHQRHAFIYAGVRPNSEEAYKLVSKGLVRPEDKSPPLIYSIKCIEFEPPDFTLELQAINENEVYLCTLVSDLGRKLRSAACVDKLRIVRVGPFTLDLALTQRQWRIESILQNIQECRKKFDELQYSTIFGTVTPGNPTLVLNDETR